MVWKGYVFLNFLGRVPSLRCAQGSGRVLAGCRPRPCFAAGGSARWRAHPIAPSRKRVWGAKAVGGFLASLPKKGILP
jgi:hypothetical protein